jgi:hypothetical protein
VEQALAGAVEALEFETFAVAVLDPLGIHEDGEGFGLHFFTHLRQDVHVVVGIAVKPPRACRQWVPARWGVLPHPAGRSPGKHRLMQEPCAVPPLLGFHLQHGLPEVQVGHAVGRRALDHMSLGLAQHGPGEGIGIGGQALPVELPAIGLDELFHEHPPPGQRTRPLRTHRTRE